MVKIRILGIDFSAGKGGVNELAVTEGGEIFALIKNRIDLDPVFKPFLEPTKGNAMNQDVSFGGTQEIIHNGGSSTEWDAAALQGSWDFSTSNVITLTSGVNQDAATFSEEGATTIDMSGFVVLTGAINLTTYNDVNNTLTLEFDNAGTLVGNTVQLNDFIDTTDIGNAQNFAVLLTEFGITTQLVDGFTVTLGRAGGPQVSFTLDDITLQQTGTPLVFKVESDPEVPFSVTELRLAFADTFAGTVANGTMTGIVHDQILGLAALSTGIVFRRTENGKAIFSVTLKDLGDFLATGSNLINQISDGTDTYFTLLIEFPVPVVLQGPASENFLSFTINDNLSTLTKFTAAARGAEVRR